MGVEKSIYGLRRPREGCVARRKTHRVASTVKYPDNTETLNLPYCQKLGTVFSSQQFFSSPTGVAIRISSARPARPT